MFIDLLLSPKHINIPLTAFVSAATGVGRLSARQDLTAFLQALHRE